MSTPRRQTLLLALLAMLLAWFGWQRLVIRHGEEGVTTNRVAGRTGSSTHQDVQRVEELDVQRLEPQTGVFTPGRDIFHYGTSPVVRPPVEMSQPQAAAVDDAVQSPGTAPSADGTPASPRVELTYLGSFGPDDAPIVVFSDGATITNARQGDVLDGRYIVRRIGYESVDLGFVGLPDDVVQRLGAGQ